MEIAPIALVGGVGNVPRVHENPLQGCMLPPLKTNQGTSAEAGGAARAQVD